MAKTKLGSEAERLIETMNKDNVQESWDKFEELVDQAEAIEDQEALWEIRNTGESLLMFYDAIRITRGKNKEQK